MQEEKKYGCVYFFKHIGLTPVKIGYSSNNNPIKRFEQFKVYAPFGAEILGFIQTKDAKILESTLHQKYVSKRLDGEWFEISELEVHQIIDFYTNKEQIEDRNNFQIEYAKFLENNRKIEEKISVKDQIKKIVSENSNVNKSKLANDFKISRRTLYKYLKN